MRLRVCVCVCVSVCVCVCVCCLSLCLCVYACVQGNVSKAWSADGDTDVFTNGYSARTILFMTNNHNNNPQFLQVNNR